MYISSPQEKNVISYFVYTIVPFSVLLLFFFLLLLKSIMMTVLPLRHVLYNVHIITIIDSIIVTKVTM